MTKHIGVKTYISPRERELTPEEEHIREVAYTLKKPFPWAIQEAVKVMESYIPSGAILIPIPNSRGNTDANKKLAVALAKRTNASVYDILSRNSKVPSSHKRRRKGLPGLSPDDHDFEGQLSEDLKRRDIIFIDNVITTGSTFDAAKNKLGTGRGLAYARANEVLKTSQKVMGRKVLDRYLLEII